MKVIFLMRHGKSDWEPAGVSDFNRPLSERGIRDVLTQGQALLKEGYRPAKIFTSPAIRAWQTAHLLAQMTSLPHEAVQPEMGFYREESDAVYASLTALPEGLETIALVGHNPLWSFLASQWSGESIEMATSEIIAFGFDGEWGGFPHKLSLIHIS
ncbi:MAG: histidine phosphatase family protein, partial [Bacteroidia bacterium]|nr:histidine phosphatase family protein [Bacteroidia bacterium]